MFNFKKNIYLSLNKDSNWKKIQKDKNIFWIKGYINNFSIKQIFKECANLNNKKAYNFTLKQ